MLTCVYTCVYTRVYVCLCLYPSNLLQVQESFKDSISHLATVASRYSNISNMQMLQPGLVPFAPRRPAKREAKRRPATAYSKRQTVACSSLVGREVSLSMSTWSTWSTWHDFGRLLRSFMTQTSVIRKLRTSLYFVCARGSVMKRIKFVKGNAMCGQRT